ncbi:MAG: ArsR/SmtB family transcription factor [Solirubrobacteraceae bacterium]
MAKYFRGLGDPTRLQILRLLDREGELAAGELVRRVGLPQATVSTHLGCLRARDEASDGFVRPSRGARRHPLARNSAAITARNSAAITPLPCDARRLRADHPIPPLAQ